jgi:uncharacterized protein YjiS (DUF1127 family)
MTTATLPRLARPSSGPARLIRLIADFIDGVREGNAMAYRYERLSRMSNAELARLGLTRLDIPQAVVNGTAGR